MFRGFGERRFNIANLIRSDINDLIVSVHGHKYDINYMLLIYYTNTGMHNIECMQLHRFIIYFSVY